MHKSWKRFADAVAAQTQAEAEHGRGSWDAGAAKLRTDSEWRQSTEAADRAVRSKFGSFFGKGE